MKILHLCLACFYIDGYSYQENILPRLNKEDGHEVKIIASTETYIDNKNIGYVKAGCYETEYGVPIVRLAYCSIGNNKIKSKIRKYKGLYKEIALFEPDVIMAHDLCFASIVEIVEYIKMYPNVRFYADTHTALYNSGKNWISLNILHRLLYRRWIQRAVPYINKYFYLSTAERDFSINNYGFPTEKMEFYPLGGFPLDDNEYNGLREKTRIKYNIDKKSLLFIHSGKLNKPKKTIELLKAFSSVGQKDFKLIIVGSIGDDIKDEFEKMVNNDGRISFLGWKNADELRRLLCAADLYLQPGSVSATMQNAVCCRCPVLSFPHASYKEFEYGQFIWVETEQEIVNAFKRIEVGQYDLSKMSLKANQCARELLDYRVLAKRLYE